jgi:ABC-2 type transport system ATP-binding protein
MLQARNLRKRFGKVVALDGVTFGAAPGETVGLLGPNGAGKTTAVSVIAGLLKPDSGEVLVNGRMLRSDTDPAKRGIGLVPQDIGLFEEISARENLALFAALYGLGGGERRKAVDEALDFVGLADRAKDKVAGFSGGMKRRLNIAAALLHDPQLLLLDEPTVGVDPQSRNAIFDNLEILKRRGKTLLYTTHYMEEAERLCDRLVIMDHGNVIADDTMAGLHKLLPAANVLTIEIGEPDGLQLDEVKQLRGVRSAEVEAGMLKVGLDDVSADSPGVLRWLSEQGLKFDRFNTERETLEAVFLNLTGRSLRD